MRRVLSAAIVCILAISVSLAVLPPVMPSRGSSHYVERGPISIQGDEDLTPENGVVRGSGTPDDPFVIEGWIIDATKATGVHIEKTKSHVVLRDLAVRGSLPGWPGIWLEGVSNVTLQDLDLSTLDSGVLIAGSKNVAVVSLKIESTGEGAILVDSSANVTIVATRISSPGSSSVMAVASSGVVMEGNVVGEPSPSLRLADVSDVVIRGSVLPGLQVHDSTRLLLEENELYAGGLRLLSTTRATLRGNNLLAGDIRMEGDEAAHYATHVISPDNTVGGLPVRYYTDCSGLSIDGEQMGQLIVANCVDLSITNLRMEGPGGLLLGFVRDGVVVNNTLTSTLELRHSSGIKVTHNTVTGAGTGLLLGYTSRVLVLNNTLAENGVGALILGSDDVTVSGNTFARNLQLGLSLVASADVLVYHNDFIDNANQASAEESSTPVWDAGYPTGGNYWSDYGGVDRCSGPRQDVCTGPDGIGDTPHEARGLGMSLVVDRYPLVEPNDPRNVRPEPPSPVGPLALVLVVSAAVGGLAVYVVLRRRSR